MKSTNTLAGEIKMSTLLSKMIKIFIESAGARKGMLILLDEENNLTIEAEGNVDVEEVKVLQSIPIDDSDNLLPAIIRYVADTKETVVLDNAANDTTYVNNPYIKLSPPRSVLCTPLINQGRMAAILYMENNLSTGAFTTSRVDMLSLLSTQAAISIENARMIEQVKEKQRLKNEMAIVERIQSSIVPPAPEHEELDMAALMVPAKKICGDYYDIIPDEEGKLWLTIGDVTGHGLTSGLIMMMAQTAFNSEVLNYRGKSPGDVINAVNKVITQNIRSRLKVKLFMTMAVVKYHGNGKFTYAGAHNDLVVYRKITGTCDRIKLEGLYLGIKPDISHTARNSNLDIDVGDILVLYTDGIIEARHKDDRKQLFGIDILQDVVIEYADEDADKIMEAIKSTALEWSGYKPDDDLTMVIVKRKK